MSTNFEQDDPFADLARPTTRRGGGRPRTKPGARLDGVDPDLVDFAAEHDFTVTSGTDSPGVHVPGSRHGSGKALDLRTKDKTPEQIEAAARAARERGFNVVTRPHGTGPHMHISKGTSRGVRPAADDSDPFADLARPSEVEDPFAEVARPTTADPPARLNPPLDLPNLDPATPSPVPAPGEWPQAGTGPSVPPESVTSRVLSEEEEAAALASPTPIHFPALDRPGYADALAGIIQKRGLREPAQLAEYTRYLDLASKRGDLADEKYRARVIAGELPAARVARATAPVRGPRPVPVPQEPAAPPTQSPALPPEPAGAPQSAPSQRFKGGRVIVPVTPDSTRREVSRRVLEQAAAGAGLTPEQKTEFVNKWEGQADLLGIDDEQFGLLKTRGQIRALFTPETGGPVFAALKEYSDRNEEEALRRLTEETRATAEWREQARQYSGQMDTDPAEVEKRVAGEVEGTLAETIEREGSAQGEYNRRERLSRLGWGEYAGRMAKQAGRGAGSVIGSALQGVGVLSEGLAKIAGAATGSRDRNYRADRDSIFYALGDRLNDAMGEDRDLAPEFASKVAGGVGSSVPFLLLGALGAGSVAAGGALAMGGGTYSDLTKKGVRGNERLAFALASMPVGASELFGVGRQMQALSGGRFLRSFASFLRETGKEATEEALQEFFQTAAGETIMAAAESKDKTVRGRWANVMANAPQILAKAQEAAAVGGITGGLFGSIGGGAQALGEMVRPSEGGIDAGTSAPGERPGDVSGDAAGRVPDATGDGAVHAGATSAEVGAASEGGADGAVRAGASTAFNEDGSLRLKPTPLVRRPKFDPSHAVGVYDEGQNLTTVTPYELNRVESFRLKRAGLDPEQYVAAVSEGGARELVHVDWIAWPEGGAPAVAEAEAGPEPLPGESREDYLRRVVTESVSGAGAGGGLASGGGPEAPSVSPAPESPQTSSLAAEPTAEPGAPDPRLTAIADAGESRSAALDELRRHLPGDGEPDEQTPGFNAAYEKSLAADDALLRAEADYFLDPAVGAPAGREDYVESLRDLYPDIAAKYAASVTPVPEAPDTVAAQFAALESGARRAVVIPEVDAADVSVPKGLKSLRGADGERVVYDPRQVTTAEVKRHIKDGTVGRLLGHVEPGSAGEAGVVAAFDPATGAELQSSRVSTPEGREAQGEAFKAQYPGAEVRAGGEELAAEVLTKRAAPPADVSQTSISPAAPATPAAGEQEASDSLPPASLNTSEVSNSFNADQLQPGAVVNEGDGAAVARGDAAPASSGAPAPAAPRLRGHEVGAGAGREDGGSSGRGEGGVRAGKEVADAARPGQGNSLAVPVKRKEARQLAKDLRARLEAAQEKESDVEKEAGANRDGQVRQAAGARAVEEDAGARAEEGRSEDAAREEIRRAVEAADADAEPTYRPFPEGMSDSHVPRASMPQVRGEHRGAMVQFLKSRGITHEQTEVPPDELRPSQADWSPEKVKKALGFEGPDRSILVSSDGHVADGHHQWLAGLLEAPAEPYPVIRLDAPIQQLLVEMARFPSATPGDAQGTPAKTAQGSRRAKKPTRYQQTGVRRRPSFDPTAHDLTRFVISEGGISVDRDGANRGELERFLKARPGLLNNKSGKTVEEMTQAAAYAGFPVLDGGGYYVPDAHALNITNLDPDRFLDMLDDDVRGLRKHYTRENEITVSEVDELNPEQREEFDAELRFLADSGVVRLLQEVRDGREDEGLREELSTLAANYGVADEVVDFNLDYAREGGLAGQGDGEGRAEEGEGPDTSFDFADDEVAPPTDLSRAEQPSMLEPTGGLFGGPQESAQQPTQHPADIQRERLLAQEAERRAESLREAFGDDGAEVERLSKSDDKLVRAVASSLLDRAGEMRAREGEGAKDLTLPLRRLADLREQGVSVDEYERQGAMFGQEMSPAQVATMRAYSSGHAEARINQVLSVSRERAEYEATKARVKGQFRELLSPSTLASGLYPAHVVAEMLPDLARLAAYHVREGARTLAELTAKLVEDLGEGIRPHAERIYAEARKLIEGGEDGRVLPDEAVVGVQPERVDGTVGGLVAGDGATAAGAQDDTYTTSADVDRPDDSAGRSASPRPERQDGDSARQSRDRAFPRTLEAAGLEGGTDRTYEVYSNKLALEDADEILAEKGVEGSVEHVLTVDDWGAEHTALAYRLLSQLDGQRAVDVAAAAARALTRQGQAVQAAQIVSRLAPERVAVVASRVAQAAGTDLTPEHLANIKKHAARALEQEERADALAKKLANAQATVRRLRDERPRKKRETPGIQARKMTNRLISRLETMEAEARARMEARKNQAPMKVDGERGASIIPLDIADLAVIGAAKMARGTLKRSLWFNDMLADFGESVRDSLPAVRRESARLYREEKRKLRREALAHSVTGGKPEEFTAAEIDELIEARRLRLRERARDEREVARAAGEQPTTRQKPDPKLGPPRPRSKPEPRQGPKLSALAREVMATTAGADEMVRAGALLIADRGDLTPDLYFQEMRARFGVNERRVTDTFRRAFEAVREARRNMADRAAENAVTGGNPSALPREEVRRLVEEREAAREAAAEARRELANAFEALDPPEPLDRALGILADVWNLPRSLKSTLDLSALGRQGYLGALSDFGAAKAAAAAKFKPLARSRRLSEEGFERVVEAIRADKHYRRGRKSGLYLASREHGRGDTVASWRAIARREEAFASRIASKIPGVGASERSYVGTLDTLRMGMFSHLADEILANKDLNEGEQRKALAYAAKRINHLTGRGTLGKSDTLGGLAVFVNGIFFAPRFMVSRFQVLSPLESARAPKGVRLITGKKVGRVLVLHGLALASLAALGFDVEWDDPEHPDWMKARLRGTEYVYDFAAGLQQPARAVLRSSARAVRALRGQAKPKESTFFSVWGDFFERKLNPSASYLFGALKGKTLEYDDVTGKKKDFEYLGHVWDEKGRLNPGGGLVDLAAPLFFKDVWESYQKHGASGVAATVPAFFGIGFADYPKREQVEMSPAVAKEYESAGKARYSAPAKLTLGGKRRELSREERGALEAEVRRLADTRVGEMLAGRDPFTLKQYEAADAEGRKKVLEQIQNEASREARERFTTEWERRNARLLEEERKGAPNRLGAYRRPGLPDITPQQVATAEEDEQVLADEVEEAGRPEVTEEQTRKVAETLDRLPANVFAEFGERLDEAARLGVAGEGAAAVADYAARGLSAAGSRSATEVGRTLRVLRMLARERRLRPVQFTRDALAGKYGEALQAEVSEGIYYPQNQFPWESARGRQ